MPFGADHQSFVGLLSLADEYYALDELNQSAHQRVFTTGLLSSTLKQHLKNQKRVLALGEQLRAMQEAVTIYCDAFTRREADVVHRPSSVLAYYTPSKRKLKDGPPRTVKKFELVEFCFYHNCKLVAGTTAQKRGSNRGAPVVVAKDEAAAFHFKLRFDLAPRVDASLWEPAEALARLGLADVGGQIAVVGNLRTLDHDGIGTWVEINLPHSVRLKTPPCHDLLMEADAAYRAGVARERSEIADWCRSNCDSGLWSVDLVPEAVAFSDRSAKREFERWYAREASSRYNV